MKNIAKYSGYATIGVITTLLGVGWINTQGIFQIKGIILNLSLCAVWFSIIELITKKE